MTFSPTLSTFCLSRNIGCIYNHFRIELKSGRVTHRCTASLHHNFPCVLNNISSSGSDKLWDLVEEFSDIFQNQSEDGVTPTLRPMKGGPEKIHFRTDVKIKPTRCTIARKVPINFEATSDREVEALVQDALVAMPAPYFCYTV